MAVQSCAELLRLRVRPKFSGKETSRSTREARRGMDPSTYTQIKEITSGKAFFQQGFAATCKD